MTLEAALGYAERGWSVVPAHSMTEQGCSCHLPTCQQVAKHPRVPWKQYQQRPANPEQIEQWWRKWATANIILVTGRVSGFIVVDVDPRHGGDESRLDLGELPDTMTSLTGGGGQHLFYKHPGRETPNGTDLLPGIDLRGDGGYVIAPPSSHVSGTAYVWEAGFGPDEAVPVDIPPTVAALIHAHRSAAGSPAERAGTFDIERALQDPIPEGARNEVMTRIAGYWLGQTDADAAQALEDLLELNNKLCQPPLGEREVRMVVRSITQREARQRAAREALGARRAGRNLDDFSVNEIRDMATERWAEVNFRAVTDWYRLTGSEPQYVVVVDDQVEIVLGNDLLSYRKVKVAIFAATGQRLTAMKPVEWEEHAEELWELAREEQVEAQRAEDTLGEWLEAFYERQPPTEWEQDVRAEQLRRYPISVDGVTYLRPTALRDFLEWWGGEKHPVRYVSRMLRRAGWMPSTVHTDTSTVRAWREPAGDAE